MEKVNKQLDTLVKIPLAVAVDGLTSAWTKDLKYIVQLSVHSYNTGWRHG